MDSLDSLLRDAAAADGTIRMEFRDRIAAYGPEAILRLEPWLSDPRIGAFAVRTIERAAAAPGAAAVARAALERAKLTGAIGEDVSAAVGRLSGRARGSAASSPQKPRRTPEVVLRDLRQFLAENAARRQLVAYSETGLNRNVVGNRLDEINRLEHAEGRPLLSVIVVHKGETMPGEGFFMCARDLGRYREGQDRTAFVTEERDAVFRAWANKQP